MKKETNVGIKTSPYDEKLIDETERFLLSAKLSEHFTIEDVMIAHDDLLSVIEDVFNFAKDLRK